MVAPPEGDDRAALKRLIFGSILGFNADAKLVTAACGNRDKLDEYGAKASPIMIGEDISCRAGPGVLHKRHADGRIEV